MQDQTQLFVGYQVRVAVALASPLLGQLSPVPRLEQPRRHQERAPAAPSVERFDEGLREGDPPLLASLLLRDVDPSMSIDDLDGVPLHLDEVAHSLAGV